MSKGNLWKEFVKGLWDQNPVFRLVLGMCPTLAVTTSAINGLGMGIATTVVLLGSNIIVSLIRPIVPKKLRIPLFITVIATFVTIVDLVMGAYTPKLHEALGIFIPLIVVNCIILARAESFASKNPLLPSIADALGIGLGFTLSLTVLGAVREILGAGSLFGYHIFGKGFEPILTMILPPGAFIALGLLLAIMNYIDLKRSEKKG